MKRLPLLAFLACLAAATAHAQSPAAAPQAAPSPDVPVPAAEAASPADAVAPAPAADAGKQPLSEANCVRETGSRIAKRDGKPRCTGQPGRAYTREDIERTGHLNLSDALRTLDPAVH